MELPEEVQKEIAAGFVTVGQVKDFHALRYNPDQMFRALRAVKDAKLKGDKGTLSVKEVLKEKRTNEKKARRLRNASELFDMQEIVRDNIGNCLATRAFAWAAGTISTDEFFKSLEEECSVPMVIPPDHNLGSEYNDSLIDVPSDIES